MGDHAADEHQLAERARAALPWGRLAFSLVLVGISIAALLGAEGIRTTRVDDAFGPRLLPQMLAVLVGLGGVTTVILTLLDHLRRRQVAGSALLSGADGEEGAGIAPAEQVEPARIGLVPVSFAVVALMFVYVWLIPMIGFRVSTFCFCLGALLICGVRKLSTLVLFPASTVLFLYLVFEQLLKVRFP